MPRLRDIADPRKREGGYFAPHLLTILIVVGVALLAFGLGVFAGENAYEQARQDYSRYKVNITVPPAAPTALLVTYSEPPNPVNQVDWTYFPGVHDQGAVGQCQCYAFSKQFSYQVNRLRHLHRWYSCKYWYALVTGGQDVGSYFDQYPPLLATTGGLLHRDYDYSGLPRSVAYPVPLTATDATGANFVLTDRAATHRYTLRSEVISMGQNGGTQALNGIQMALSHGDAVNLDLPVFDGAHSFYDLSGILDYPQGNPVGGHAVTIAKCDRNQTRQIDGTTVTGWCLISNNWGKQWGLTRDGSSGNGANGGYGLISFREIARDGFGIEVAHLTDIKPKASPPPAWSQPGAAISKPIPGTSDLSPKMPVNAGKRIKSAGNWIYHDLARDVCANGKWSTSCSTYRDMAPVVNQAAHQYGISAPGLLATLFTECGVYTHSTRCDRYGYGADVSFGRCQVTVQTAQGFGVGGGNVQTVKSYENGYKRCVFLAARVLGSYQSYLHSIGCGITFPQLYVAWNAGPGNPCWFLLSPTGQAGQNYYGTCGQCGYLYYWRVALAMSRNHDPYARKK
jgi:hypothetical protein